MRKLIASIILSLSLVACAGKPATTTVAPAIQVAQNNAVVLAADTTDVLRLPGVPGNKGILGKTSKKDAHICSGEVYRSDGDLVMIITARHCTQDGAEDTGFFGIMDYFTMNLTHVHFFDGDDGKVIGVKRSSEYDLAMILVRSGHPHDVQLKFNNTTVRGEDLFVFGMPNGMPWTFSKAYSMQGTSTIKGVAPPFNDLTAVGCDSCYFGDSGGGVYDYDGNLVGIFTATNDAPSEGFMVPSSEVQEFIESMPFQ